MFHVFEQFDYSSSLKVIKMSKKVKGTHIYGTKATDRSTISIEGSDNVRVYNTKASNGSTVSVRNSDDASVIGVEANDSSEIKIDGENSKLEEDIIDIKPNFFGLGINFNAIWKWFRKT